MGPMEGSNVNYVLGWFYYLLFLLTVVLVLMNLLNALAISDISKIIEDSKIEYMLSNIRDVDDEMDKFSLNPLSIIAQVILCPLIVIFLPCLWGLMYWCGAENFERFWKTPTSFDAIDADSGKFTLDMAFDKRIPSILPVEWKKSKLGKSLCSFFQIPQVDAREQLINGA